MFPGDIFFRYLESPGVLTLLNRELREVLWIQFLRSLGIRRLAVRDDRIDILGMIPWEYVPERPVEKETLPQRIVSIMEAHESPERILEVTRISYGCVTSNWVPK